MIHTMMMRAQRGSARNDVISNIADTLSRVNAALEDLLPADFLWQSARYIPQDSDVAEEGVDVPDLTVGSNAVNTYSATARATETTFVGSGGGSRVTISWFGLFWATNTVNSPAASGRVDLAESAFIADAIAQFNTPKFAATIASSPASWKPYANVKVNDHWLKIVRRTFP